MKIIKPSVEFYGAVPTDYDGALKFIEKCGRTCYKSEDKITEGSAAPFVRRLIKSGHLAMVEHSNFVVRVPDTSNETMSAILVQAGKFLTVRRDSKFLYVGGNLTAWYQQFLRVDYGNLFTQFAQQFGPLFGWDVDKIIEPLWEQCPHNEIPPELHRYSAKFICDRGVSHELVRHRPCSFAQESTRYVNYAGKEMEFIEPEGFERWSALQIGSFYSVCKTAEEQYNLQIAIGLKPQHARAVLPNALKTEIVVTADAAEWRHIRKLRTAKDVHPDMRRVMNMIPWEEFV